MRTPELVELSPSSLMGGYMVAWLHKYGTYIHEIRVFELYSDFLQ
ncbi:hypothetical protein F383_29842 [Gossypium arboreum]|uniref:Uncharacterized protein n=1 Tax=Gossypium arboreum TaxID=29729 RepID=A0A0B0P8V8_GOSAR|nr:hypothetical protein F383_29842 [Gossypium arboreum]